LKDRDLAKCAKPLEIMIAIDNKLSCRLSNMGFVCSCLVVLLHASQHLQVSGIFGSLMPYFSRDGIGNCAVPFFFIAAGFFLAGHMEGVGWWGRECRKRIRSLFVPYIFWNVVYWCFMHGLSALVGFLGIQFAKDLGWGLDLGFNPLSLPQHPHLWFVRSLILVVLISPVFLVVRRKILGLVVLFVIIASCIYLEVNLGQGAKSFSESFAISGWFQGLMFFPIGVYLRFNPVIIDDSCIGRITRGGGCCLPFCLGVLRCF